MRTGRVPALVWMRLMGTSRRRCEPRAGPARTLCYSVLLCARGIPSVGAIPAGGPRTPHSPTAHLRTLPAPPGQDRPPRPWHLRSFLPGCFFTQCTVCTRAAAPGTPRTPRWVVVPWPGALAPWPPPPSRPHRPHPTGQVLSLLEIKVHSLWCRGAATWCFVCHPGTGGRHSVGTCLSQPCLLCPGS